MEAKDPITILYVDDEEHNLSAFKASFRRDHDITVVQDATSALDVINTKDFEVIIADQRMPGMTGVEFFEQIKEKHTDPMRILLTAYTNSQTVIDAVNKGNIDRYLVKPWNHELMEPTLRSGKDMYETRKALRVKNRELKKTNEELNRFVYSVSHDLRAPLMSLLGLINLGKNEDNVEARTEFFDLMEKSIQKMDTYIENTLNYYRNFSSRLRVEIVQIPDLINDIINSLNTMNKEVKFTKNISGTGTFRTDGMRLKMALSNIISNAIKYGNNEGGECPVDISIENNDGILVAKIQDYGVGISDKELPLIFEMFYQSETIQDKKSTGIGLYIVKEAVDMLNGRIDVDSEPGKGTCFTLTIPEIKDE
jgi:signal transduction histidine kinase